MTTLPECCARICSSRYSFGVSVSALIVDGDGARGEIDRQRPELDHRLAARGAQLPPHRRMRARQEFGHAERLDHVIVGAEFEQPHLFGLAAAHRQHDQRHARPGPQPFQHLGAVHVGQAEIEDDQVGRLQRRRAQRLGAGLGLLHLEAVELEAGAQEAPDLDLVVDDEDGGRYFTHSAALSMVSVSNVSALA